MAVQIVERNKLEEITRQAEDGSRWFAGAMDR